MQNPIPELIQKFIIYKKAGFLSEISKALTSSNYHGIQYFFAEILHTFSTYQCLQNGFRYFFYFAYVKSY